MRGPAWLRCNDGECHRVAIEIRWTRCGNARCQVCRAGPGHGPYAYVVYKTGGKTRRDYNGRVTPKPKGARP